MTEATKSTKNVSTEQEVLALPDDGFTHELVTRELVLSPLEGKDLLPGVRHPVADLFKEWDLG